MKLHRELGITQKTAWSMAQKIRQGWDRGKAKMTGTVEVNEAYFGGKESNKHASKKQRLGRGAVGKEALVGIKSRDGEVRVNHVQDTTKETLQGHIQTHVEEGAIVFTDEHKGYIGLDSDYTHDTVKHSTGEYVRDMAHTNGIESFWAMMKRGYAGTYHKMSPKHLHRICQRVRRTA